ncbi:hypothetical protein LMBV_068 [Largemouth bass virus]|uniref:Uncharacterized protein n=1 Tax=Largemouth bass virus TaxID=176656 RepID=A0A9X7Y3C4_9VIRU|nr:hypothetical protein OA88_23070 [Flavobacterium sp. JRM]QJE49217.1 hypothetical protein LMBV_068 [Largemouth bass virus]
MDTLKLTKTTQYPYGLLNVNEPLPNERTNLFHIVAQDMMFSSVAKQRVIATSAGKESIKHTRYQEDIVLLTEKATSALTIRIEQNPELRRLLESSGTMPIVHSDQNLVGHLTLLRGQSQITREGDVFSELSLRKLYKGTIDMFRQNPASLLDLPLGSVTLETLRGLVKAAGKWPSTFASQAMPLPPSPITGYTLARKVLEDHAVSLYNYQQADFEHKLLINHLRYLDPSSEADISYIVNRMTPKTRMLVSRLTAMHEAGKLDPEVVGEAVPPDSRLLDMSVIIHEQDASEASSAANRSIVFNVPHALTFTGGPVSIGAIVYDTPLHYAYAQVLKRMYINFKEISLSGVAVNDLPVIHSDMLDRWMDNIFPETVWKFLTKRINDNHSCIATLLATENKQIVWEGTNTEYDAMLSDMFMQIRDSWFKAGAPTGTTLTDSNVVASDFFLQWLVYRMRTYSVALTVISEQTLFRLMGIEPVPIRSPTDAESRVLGLDYDKSAWKLCLSEFTVKFSGKVLSDSVRYCVLDHVRAESVSRGQVSAAVIALAGNKSEVLLNNPVIRQLLATAA